MNHPDQFEWMSYLYDETAADRRAEMDQHRRECTECAHQVATWRQAQSRLDGWALPHSNSRPRFALAWKRGLAALFLVGLGFGAGRFLAPTPDLVALRTQMEPGLRAALRDDLKSSLTAERQELVALLKDLEKQHADDYAGLRKDLETVAVMADARIRLTRADLGQMAALSDTRNNPEP